MFLNEIININNKNIRITNIDIDSRKITKGGLFFALKGNFAHGRNFVDQAIKNGAVAIISEEKSDAITTKDNIIIYNSKNAFNLLLKSLNKLYPKLPKNILAITGTNGKSSVCNFIYQFLDLLNLKSASIGTLGIKSNIDIVNSDSLLKSSLTTSDIITLYRNLNILANNNVENIVLEASSLGIEQNRLAGIDISLAAFTNFTQDHLDLHKTMENYFNAKMTLFTNLLKEKSYAILNSDIPEFSKINDICLTKNHKIFTYGKSGNFIKLLDSRFISNGWNLKLQIFGQIFDCKIKEIAEFQIYNILCALTSVITFYQLKLDQIQPLLEKLTKLKSITGRMQQIGQLPNGAKIFIDYAHTPDAILNILKNSKTIPHNKLHILFGAGGDRDKSKRPLMGRIASDFADKIIITDDNPRFEDPKQIRSEIINACQQNKVMEIGDRVEAIKYAIDNLDKDDILLIAGKGHEKYQIIGDQINKLDEEEIVMNLLS